MSSLIATGKPVVVVALGYQNVTLTALVNTLFGTPPRGHLPVTVRTDDWSGVVATFGTGMTY